MRVIHKILKTRRKGTGTAATVGMNGIGGVSSFDPNHIKSYSGLSYIIFSLEMVKIRLGSYRSIKLIINKMFLGKENK